MKMDCRFVTVLVFLVLGVAQVAQTVSAIERPDSVAAVAEYTADYQDVKGFGGPSAVGSQVRSDDEQKKSPWHFRGLSGFVQPYYDFKSRLNKNHGLAFGADYNFLFQSASKSMGDNDAAGGIFRLYATWELIGTASGNTGALVAKLENRHRIGTDIPPQSLASQVGYIGLTAIVFSDAGNLLTNLYWSQSFLQDRLAFVAGIVDATDYLDIHGLINPWTDFANLSYSTDPTIPVPNQGLGVAVRANIADHFYVLGGFADANGDPSDPLGQFDTFFNDRDYFSHIEIGRVGSRETEFTDNIHLTAWHADPRSAAQVPEGWGATVSLSQKVTQNWMPFARAGYSDGGGGVFLDRSASAGVGYFPSTRSDVVALGAAWGRPSEKTYGGVLDDQYTLEAFFRLQAFQHTTVTADVQFVIDPALNPTASEVWVLGLAARIVL